MTSGGWGAIYTLLITVTGWTWEYIGDNMTLPRLNKMTDYWKEFPPVHVSVALFLGVGSKKSKKSQHEVDAASPPSTAPVVPEDKRGNPTQEVPANIAQAASMLGGSVIRLRPKNRTT